MAANKKVANDALTYHWTPVNKRKRDQKKSVSAFVALSKLIKVLSLVALRDQAMHLLPLQGKVRAR